MLHIVLDHDFPLEQVLQLRSKGSLAVGKDGDLLVLDPETLQPLEVLAHGKRMIVDGKLRVSESFLEDSDRRIELYGQKK